MTYTTTSSAVKNTWQLGYQVGLACHGGETIELISDLGGGKTVFAQGLAAGLGYEGDVSSPTFVISRDYQLPNGNVFHHFDLYRIGDGDMAAAELAEFVGDPHAIVAVEWASNVKGVLPKDRITAEIQPIGDDQRNITITTTSIFDYISKALQAEEHS